MKAFVVPMAVTLAAAAKDCFVMDFEALQAGSTVTRLEAAGDFHSESVDVFSASYPSATKGEHQI